MGKKNLVSEWQKIKCWFGSVTTYKKKKIKDFNYLTNILTPSHMCLDFSLISRIQYVEKKNHILTMIDWHLSKKKKKLEATFGTPDGNYVSNRNSYY